MVSNTAGFRPEYPVNGDVDNEALDAGGLRLNQSSWRAHAQHQPKDDNVTQHNHLCILAQVQRIAKQLMPICSLWTLPSTLPQAIPKVNNLIACYRAGWAEATPHTGVADLWVELTQGVFYNSPSDAAKWIVVCKVGGATRRPR